MNTGKQMFIQSIERRSGQVYHSNSNKALFFLNNNRSIYSKEQKWEFDKIIRFYILSAFRIKHSIFISFVDINEHDKNWRWNFIPD